MINGVPETGPSTAQSYHNLEDSGPVVATQHRSVVFLAGNQVPYARRNPTTTGAASQVTSEYGHHDNVSATRDPEKLYMRPSQAASDVIPRVLPHRAAAVEVSA